MNFLLRIFIRGKLSFGLNDSLICLLSKMTHPEDFSQFSPISLCNVLVKLISKVLANRLKLLMFKLAGKCKLSFIPGRTMMDNIIIAQEMVQSIRRRKGNQTSFILKVDLEKAYDIMDWSFSEKF